MYSQDIKGVDFVICNTDAQALDNSPIPNKVQLGADLTEGMGAGANPDVGAKAAEESYIELRDLLSTNTKMVFITAGMGGGTGTGAAPVIAKIAKELDLLTVGIVTMPFEFEGRSRMQQAQKGISALREHVDSLIVINNNKLREVYGNLGYKSGFSKADEVLSTAARGIAEVITHHYKQNIDLNDAKAVLSNSGTAIMGSATAFGEERAQKAIVGALDSPLLNDNKITGAKNVLLLIVSGTHEVTIDEIGEINDHIRNEAGYDVNIILGIGDDESIGDAIAVTIIATGFSSGQQHEITDTEVKKIVHTLEDNQELQFDFSDKKETSKTATPLDDDKKQDFFQNKVVHSLDEEIDFKDLTPTTDHIKDMEVEFDEIQGDSTNNIDSIISLDEGSIDIKEDLFEMLPTSEFIENIDIIYDEVIADVSVDDEFIITDEAYDIVEEADESYKQMKLTFDFPINDEVDAGIEITDEIKEIEVVEAIQIEANFEEVKTHNLNDFIEEYSTIDNESSEEQTIEEDADLQFELKTITKKEVINKQSENDNSNNKNEIISPLNVSIEEFKKTVESRKMHLKKHNYTFHKNLSNIDEIEKEPAYKRQNIELDENPSSADNFQSRTTIDSDENDGIQLRKNNSFLHDNVD
jgi:cell division protein FtsZ